MMVCEPGGKPLGSSWSGGTRVSASDEPESASFPRYEGAKSVDRVRKAWRGIEAAVDEVRSDGAIESSLTADVLQVSVVLGQVGGRFHLRSSSAQEPGRGQPGPLSLLPAGTRVKGGGEPLLFLRHMSLRIDGSQRHVVSPEGGTPALRLMFDQPNLVTLCRLISEECCKPTEGDLYADSLVTALLAALGRTAGADEGTARARMAGWQLRRTKDYLKAHLISGISIDDLADLTNMSRSYFCRAFRNSVGTSPYQYFIDSRIGEAKRMLVEGRQSLADISFAVGFTDQAHFSRTFRRIVGDSPGAWQKVMRGEDGAMPPRCPPRTLADASLQRCAS